MKKKIVISILILACVGGACSSLQDSTADKKMRFQGSFACTGVSSENSAKKETLAEADVSRIRCAKDEWQIHGDQVIYTRTLYQLKTCDNVLGRIQFSEPFTETPGKLTIPHPHCKLVRLNPNWLGEASGKCMLNELALKKPYDLHAVYRCKVYVPEFCENAEPLLLQSEGKTASVHDPVDQIGVTEEGSSKIMSCKRYAGD